MDGRQAEKPIFDVGYSWSRTSEDSARVNESANVTVSEEHGRYLVAIYWTETF